MAVVQSVHHHRCRPFRCINTSTLSLRCWNFQLSSIIGKMILKRAMNIVKQIIIDESALAPLFRLRENKNDSIRPSVCHYSPNHWYDWQTAHCCAGKSPIFEIYRAPPRARPALLCPKIAEIGHFRHSEAFMAQMVHA